MPANSVRELIVLAGSRAGQFNYASSGSGAAAHLVGELFKAMTHVDIVHVPYKGAQPALTDLIAGHSQLMFATSASVVPYIKSGRLRALAVTTAQRSALLPDLRERLAGLGAEVTTGTPREFADYIARETPKWAEVVKNSEARAD